jgi:hypothetical protein
MMKQSTGLRRDTIDKYYTKPNIAAQCISYIMQHIEISPQDTIIEPSAGNGAFLMSPPQPQLPHIFCVMI